MILPLSPLPTCPMSHQVSLWVERLIYQQCKNVSFLNPVKHLFLLDPIFPPQLSSWPQLVSCYKQSSARMYSQSQHPTILHSQQFHVRKYKCFYCSTRPLLVMLDDQQQINSLENKIETILIFIMRSQLQGKISIPQFPPRHVTLSLTLLVPYRFCRRFVTILVPVRQGRSGGTENNSIHTNKQAPYIYQSS